MFIWEEFQTTRNPELVIDPFGGMQDLKNGILRHVSDAFVEDPVRVLRVARFAARYDFSVAADTLELMAKLTNSSELNELTPERVFAEFEKAVMEDFPMKFFTVLNTVGALDVLFPELFEQWHPIQTVETLDRCVLLDGDFLDRVVILSAGSDTQNILGMFERLKAPKVVTKLLKLSCTLINSILDHSHPFDDADDFIAVLDEVNAWKLPTNFIKTAQVMVIFDSHFIHSMAFKLLKMFRAGIIVDFDMLTTEQQETLKGKEIGEAISALRRNLLRGMV